MIDIATELKTIDRLMSDGGSLLEISRHSTPLLLHLPTTQGLVSDKHFIGLSSEFLEAILMGWALAFEQFKEHHTSEETKPSGLN